MRICLLACLLTASLGAAPELVDVRRIWSGAKHNAFGDLIRFQGEWFAVCRESVLHVPLGTTHEDDGKIRVITSKDGLNWTSAALLAEQGIDLRDPHISITPEGMLMLTMGGSVYDNKVLKARQPRVAFSKDGREWSAPTRILAEGDWLWRVTWFNGRGYGVSYGGPRNQLRGSLWSTDDGLKFTKVTDWTHDGVNETTLRFLANGDMIALARRDYSPEVTALIGVSSPPYTRWTWKDSGQRIGGPNFLVLPDGAMWAGGRDYTGATRMALGRFTPDAYTPELSLPAQGDSSYPGLVWHDGMLWVMYYASHEEGTNLYMARVRLR
jgi:hypothetical protein